MSTEQLITSSKLLLVQPQSFETPFDTMAKQPNRAQATGHPEDLQRKVVKKNIASKANLSVVLYEKTVEGLTPRVADFLRLIAQGTAENPISTSKLKEKFSSTTYYLYVVRQKLAGSNLTVRNVNEKAISLGGYYIGPPELKTSKSPSRKSQDSDQSLFEIIRRKRRKKEEVIEAGKINAKEQERLDRDIYVFFTPIVLSHMECKALLNLNHSAAEIVREQDEQVNIAKAIGEKGLDRQDSYILGKFVDSVKAIVLKVQNNQLLSPQERKVVRVLNSLTARGADMKSIVSEVYEHFSVKENYF